MNDYTSIAGIDVGKKQLVVALEGPDGESHSETFANDRNSRSELIEFLTSAPGSVLAVLESTGNYGIDLARELWATESVGVVVENPRKVRHFAGALLQRSKTDALDAEVLLEYARRMPTEQWSPPRTVDYRLRKHSRHLARTKDNLTRLKNRLESYQADSLTPGYLLDELNREIGEAEKRAERILARSLEVIAEDAELSRRLELLLSIPGVGDTSAVCILGELATLPAGMGPRQWVAYSGLDPVQHKSGTSVESETRISHDGNSYLRRALYFPALNGKKNKTIGWAFARFRERLEERGLEPMQSTVALMRKMLHVIYGMFRHDECFDPHKVGDLEKPTA